MRSNFFVPVAFAALATSTAAQSCTAPPFYNNPAYGPKSGCVPTNYNSAADLGNTNPTDAATRCSQQCSRVSTCGGWVVQLNKAADSGLYTGQCFIYTSLPATPRSCADKPSELVAGVRDDTGKCFTSSKAAATAFCSSYLGIGQKTVTAFANTPTVTNTATVTNTVPSTSTTVTTIKDTVTTIVATATDLATSVTVVTELTTTTITPVAIQPVTKRAVAPPGCVASGVPASQLTAQCQCLSITSGTVTTTLTPAATTVSTTITATATSLVVEQQTTLLTVTVPATSTEKTTTLTTTTTTVQATATACVPSVPSGNILVNPGFNDGTYTGWNPGGYGGFLNSIVSDAQCGAYGSRITITAGGSYGRIGQRFTTIDTTKNYRITTYARKVSGDGTNCFYYLSCQLPGSFSSAGNPRLDTPLNSIPEAWTQYSLNCPVGANQLTMSLTVQCNQGSGPITIGLDEIYMFPI
ncbi:hypothetical protein IQ06DRAFT_353471 [Phaeosphaeriaceae sp. SRC1lsM3a]|nr:hypothetical protein IQ06DRAFT_353471 [Stagonospora sp. SRC1lsM3a]